MSRASPTTHPCAVPSPSVSADYHNVCNSIDRQIAAGVPRVEQQPTRRITSLPSHSPNLQLVTGLYDREPPKKASTFSVSPRWSVSTHSYRPSCHSTRGRASTCSSRNPINEGDGPFSSGNTAKEPLEDMYARLRSNVERQLEEEYVSVSDVFDNQRPQTGQFIGDGSHP